ALSRGAGGVRCFPVVTSNWAPCQGQVTTLPSRSPSQSGAPRWQQVSSMAQIVPPTLNRATCLPLTVTCLPLPTGISCTVATLVNAISTALQVRLPNCQDPESLW